MWRKRQAQASDQQSWRALGTDSALWKGIEKNSGNVKTALGSGTTSGIVTGLKFTNDTGDALHPFIVTNNNDNFKMWNEIFYASDPNKDNLHTGTGGTDRLYHGKGSGLVFSARLFGEITVDKQIPGLKHVVLDGGSGYEVGQKMYLQPRMISDQSVSAKSITITVTSVTDTKIPPGIF